MLGRGLREGVSSLIAPECYYDDSSTGGRNVNMFRNAGKAHDS